VSTSHPELIAWFIQVGKLENSLNSSECGCGSTFNVIADSLVMHGTGEETDDSTLLFSMARHTVAGHGSCIYQDPYRGRIK
jgi:hypothetical protein